MSRCERCGGIASLVVSERRQRGVRLCEACANRIAPELRPSAFLAEFHRHRRQDGNCPFCGWTNEQYVESSLLGCPLCYEALDLHLLSRSVIE